MRTAKSVRVVWHLLELILWSASSDQPMGRRVDCSQASTPCPASEDRNVVRMGKSSVSGFPASHKLMRGTGDCTESDPHSDQRSHGHVHKLSSSSVSICSAAISNVHWLEIYLGSLDYH